MPRNTLTEAEFNILAAAVGTISDTALRNKLAAVVKSAVEEYAPESRRRWKQFFALCRADNTEIFEDIG